jgi:lanosterol synthase
MSHANGKSNGATKRSASPKILNDAVDVTKNEKGDEKTDYTRWRLKDDRGCQTWHYLTSDEEVKAWPQSTADKYFLGLNTVGVHLF